MSRGYRFDQLVEHLRAFTEVETLVDPGDDSPEVFHADIHRPGMALMGYADGFHPERIQVVGETELGYLATLDTDGERAALARVFDLGLAGIFIAIAFKLVPAYTDHQTLKTIMQSTRSDQQLMSRSKRDILRGINKKMGINNMRDIPKDYLKITKDKGDVLMDVEYNVRIPIFMNVDALVSFKEQYVGHELD